MPRLSATLRALLLVLATLAACSDDPSPRPPPDGGLTPATPRDATARDAAWLPGPGPDAGPTLADAATPDGSVADAPPARVTTSLGVLDGLRDGRTRMFLGIPYAAPPVGALRFAPPQPPAPFGGVRDARQHGAICPQVGDLRGGLGLPALPQSEDCLTLNVYAPTVARSAPVMVFLHGGSGTSGSGADYDGRILSRAGDVVVVTLNYRLGLFSTLALPALDRELGEPSGNLALRDQQRALQWVHDEIAAFGGDPGNVTLFGQSAGAIHGCLQLFSPGTAGLVQRVILESGGCLGSAVSPASRAQAESVSRDVASNLCGSAPDALACLRALPLAQLRDLSNSRASLLEQFGTLHVDGRVLPDHPVRLARRGAYLHVPVIVGSNAHESSFLASPVFGQSWPLVSDALSFTIGVAAMYPDDFAAILAEYGVPSDADANARLVAILDDSWFTCPARALTRELASRGDAVYAYRFTLAPAGHTLELDYVFGWPEGLYGKVLAGAAASPVPELVQAVQSYWTAFARGGASVSPSRPAWAAWTVSDPAHLTLDRSIARGGALGEGAHCDFWDARLITPHAP